MTLKIYSTPEASSFFSSGGQLTNPIRYSFDGRFGEVIERRAFVRNSSNLHSYTEIQLVPIDSGDNLVDDSQGFSIKLRAGEDQPINQEWDTIAAGNTINLSDLTDTSTYLPFWIRIEVPKGADVASYASASIRINATKNLL